MYTKSDELKKGNILQMKGIFFKKAVKFNCNNLGEWNVTSFFLK